MTPRSTISKMAALVEGQPEAFDYVHRIELERALFALVRDFAITKLGVVISGFSDDVLQELQALAADRARTIATVHVLMGLLQKIHLISSGDPYITLDGEDVILEGRREVIVSLGGDLRTLLEELDSLA